MELKVESNVGKIAGSQERIFNFLSDFTNFSGLLPADKVKNFQASNNECTFEADGIGKSGLKIIEKDPYKTIKITGAQASQEFFFWVQLKEVAPYDTRIKLTIKTKMNMVMKMMMEKQLKKFLDTLVEQICKIPF